MKDLKKSAVTLSIISTPSKFGLWNTLSLSPDKILTGIMPGDLKTQEIIGRKYSFNAVNASDLIIERCRNKKINIVTIWDDEYPQLLKQIHNPPLVLYSTGEIPGNKMVSIVGTRDSDEKAEAITKKISGRAVTAGYTIVSGMALGIDRNAHLGALISGGSTVAVLPGGVDIIYPEKNTDIYRMILDSESSAVISEYPPGIGTGQKWTFARRNRIISGISGTVVLIQAPLKSGAMITARYAIEQNRDLFVCPGNAFDEKYCGCHELIKQGAAVFSDMTDLFAETEPVNISVNIPVSVKNNNIITLKDDCDPGLKNEIIYVLEHTGKTGLKIYEELKKGFIVIDEFIRLNNFSTEEVNQCITFLEISGYIERKGNRLYKL